jgi:hypothetical protein
MTIYKFTNREDALNFKNEIISSGQDVKKVYHIGCKVIITK